MNAHWPGSYSKISSLAQLHDIVKLKKNIKKKNAKLLINVRFDHMRKVC